MEKMRCPYGRCGDEVPDDWAFCGNCGTPTGSPASGPCDHDFELVGPFCVRCGWDGDASFGLQAPARLAAGVLGCVVAFGALIWGVLSFAARDKMTVMVAARTFPLVIFGLAVAAKLLVPRRVERARN